MDGSSPNFSTWVFTLIFLSLMWSCQSATKEESKASIPEEILAPEEATGKFPYRRLFRFCGPVNQQRKRNRKLLSRKKFWLLKKLQESFPTDGFPLMVFLKGKWPN